METVPSLQWPNVKELIKHYRRLTDLHWNTISVFLDTKRKRKLNLRDVMDTILYILRTGCQWRNLPASYPSWQAVFWQSSNGIFPNGRRQISSQKLIFLSINSIEKINGRDENPAIFSIDSQSVKLSLMIWKDRGLDAHKKVNAGQPGGRKRQLLVDSGGRLWFARIHTVNLHDGAAALGFMSDIICQTRAWLKYMVTRRVLGFSQSKLKNMRLNLKKRLSKSPPKALFQLRKDGWSKPRRRTGTIAWSNFSEELSKIMNILSLPVQDGCI